MADLKIIWEDDALRLLMDRDRYTRNAIQEEFRKDPETNKVPLDNQGREYLTRVSEQRFAVVWQFDPQLRVANVRAVVPISRLPTENLKEYIDRLVAAEIKRTTSQS